MLVNVGVNYRGASIATLDSLTIRDVDAFYKRLNTISGVSESVVLQTCNRVEMFLETRRASPTDTILRVWALAAKFNLGELQRVAEVKTGDAVVEHSLRLASGLESMILGEPQILGQMRESLGVARTLGKAGPALSELFERAMSNGAKIRTQTGIGKGVTTVGSAALKLAEQMLGSLEDLRVLLLGTGEVGALVMKALKARGLSKVAVTGRNREKVESFCRSFGGAPVPFHRLEDQLRDSDLLFVATKSSRFLIDANSFSRRAKDSQRELMILDLSNPRNVAPEVGQIDGVNLRTIDDLNEITEAALASKRETAKKAEPLVQEAVERISAGLRRETAEPIVSDAFHQAEEIRVEELHRALTKLKLSPEQELVVERMSQKIVEKVLNGPATSLRRAAEKTDSLVLTVAS